MARRRRSGRSIRQARGPETRRPKEIRGPKSEPTAARADQRPSGLSLLRVSGFGLPSIFGFFHRHPAAAGLALAHANGETVEGGCNHTLGVERNGLRLCRLGARERGALRPVSYTHLRAHETRHELVCRLLLEKR